MTSNEVEQANNELSVDDVSAYLLINREPVAGTATIVYGSSTMAL